MRVERIVFAGVGTAHAAGLGRFSADALLSGYGCRSRHFRAPDGRRYELLDRPS